MDPPSPSALAFQAFSRTNRNRFDPGPGPAPLTPEDVARSVQALADAVLQLRCEVTNLRLALDTLSSDRPSTPVRFLEKTVSALVEALHQDRVESRLLLQQLNCHFDNIRPSSCFCIGAWLWLSTKLLTCSHLLIPWIRFFAVMSAEFPAQLASALAASDFDRDEPFTPPRVKRYKNRSFVREVGGAQLAQAPDQLQVQAVAPQSSDAAPAALNPALPVLPLTPPVSTAALPCEPQAGSPISGSSPRSLPPPISIPSSSAFATPKSARSSGTGSWSVVSPALRSLFRPQSKYGPPLPRPAHLQARTPRRGPYPAPVPGCTPLPLPRYHRSPPAGFSAPLPAPVLRPASFYAIYPSSRLAQAACPKALQASGSELKLADPSAAHGASQMHSQTLAKHSVLPKVASNGFGSTQPLGQALRPPLAGLASAQPGAVLQETLHTQAWDSILLLWHSLCEFIAPLSQVVQELATSVNRRALTLKLLQVNSDTTVSRYVSSCLSFFSFVADLGLDLSALTQVQAVEAVMALHLSKHQDQDDPLDASSAALVHPVNTLKALRWLIKVTLLRFPDAYGGLFRALSSGPTSDRKEALALPLDFVAFLEALVLDPGSEPSTVSFAGAGSDVD